MEPLFKEKDLLSLLIQFSSIAIGDNACAVKEIPVTMTVNGYGTKTLCEEINIMYRECAYEYALRVLDWINEVASSIIYEHGDCKGKVRFVFLYNDGDEYSYIKDVYNPLLEAEVV